MGDSKRPLSAHFQSLKTPSHLRIVPNDVFLRNHPDIECIDLVHARTGEKLGFICLSSNKDFVQEMGIVEYDTLPKESRPARRPASGLLVATPMRQYPMNPFVSGGADAASAVVDCDTHEGPIYRPTSNCHVATTGFDKLPILYSNFVLTDHTASKTGVSKATIQMLWLQLLKH